MMENLICILAFTSPLLFRIRDWKKPDPYLSVILQILLWIVFHSALISAAVMMLLYVVYGYCVKKNTLLTCMAEGMLLMSGFSLPVLLVLVRPEYAMVQPYLYLLVNCLIASGIETAEKAVSDSSERLVWSMNTVAALCLSSGMISLYFVNRKSVSALLIGFMYVCTLFCLVLYMKEKQKNDELERIRSLLSLSREQMEQWQAHALETVQLRHDMNHHLCMM